MKEIFSFNRGWKFKRDEKTVCENNVDYFDSFKSNSKTGIMDEEKSAGFCDLDWKEVCLPHDWVITEAISENNSVSQGRRPQGVAWYRKHFILSEEYKDKKIYVKFDGIAISSEIYLNNIKVASGNDGYVPIMIDITDFVLFDRNNTISVKTDCSVKEGWWYEGGGIYRDAYIIIKEQSHFDEDGVFVYSEQQENNNWKLVVKSKVENYDNCTVVAYFNGEKRSKEAIDNNIICFEIKEPMLWDCNEPNLYDVNVELVKNGEILEKVTLKTGFRRAEFHSETGFWLNGKNQKIKGMALHHDHGGVGVAVDENIIRYKLNRLKDMGCNAIRTAHNPHSSKLIQLCDEMGFLVMDEIRHFSSTEECLKNLKKFIMRDRNHPSVIMWSLFNEEALQCTVTGEKIIKSMCNVVRENDPTRLITGAMNGPIEINGVVKYIDVVGFNYMMYGYDKFHELFPEIPIFGSETGSYMSTRDEMITDKEKSHICCYSAVRGENLYPWASTPGEVWKNISERKFVAGGFYWTGTDYYGETGPFHWPGITSNFGTMDVCGFPKNNYFWHKALWKETPELKIMGKWQSDKATLICYSNCDKIELIADGKIIVNDINNVYSPKVYEITADSEITALGYIDNQKVCEDKIIKYERPYSLCIIKENDDIKENENIILNVFLKDRNGQIVKSESGEITITLSNADLIGASNGDNSYHRNVKDRIQNLFHGCAQFIVRATKQNCSAEFSYGNISETIDFTARHEAIKEINSVEFKSYAFNHMMSDVIDYYPNKKDMKDSLFAWIPTAIHNEKSLMMSGKKGYVLLNSIVLMSSNPTDKILVIENVSGNIDVYLGETQVFSSNGFINETIKINVDNTTVANNNIVHIIFKLNGEDCGISGNMYMEF